MQRSDFINTQRELGCKVFSTIVDNIVFVINAHPPGFINITSELLGDLISNINIIVGIFGGIKSLFIASSTST